MLKIEPFFCTTNEAIDMVDWEVRDAIIRNGDDIVFEQKNVDVPANWSDTALNIAASKYLYKGSNPETSIYELVDRVCHTIAEWGREDNYFSVKNAKIFCNELATLMLKQMACFNSPVLFNVGLSDYGVQGDPYGWRWDSISRSVVQCLDPYLYPQVSACFIQSVSDNMPDIMELAKSQAMLFKYGSGTGTNYSSLRSKRETLSGGGQASGPLSFMRISDAVAEVVRSGGKTRRAAIMRILNIDHPDILDFINAKEKVEKLARDLIVQGHDPISVYSMLPFQNANHTVRISDKFMHLLDTGGEWETNCVNSDNTFPAPPAEEIWDLIATRAHQSGDPGVQFHDTINRWNPICEQINSSNPCSEFMFIDDSACNLASINLRKFQKQDGTLDVRAFQKACRLMIIAQDIMVDRASYPTKKICENSHHYRPLGLGYTNFGAFLMSQGIPYDSEEGRRVCSEVTLTMQASALFTSAELAKVLGAFDEFDEETGPMNIVLDKHIKASDHIHPDYRFEFWRATDSAKAYGLRNAQLTLLAPTGTISFLMDCDTTGIEPEMALAKKKTLSGGGVINQINLSVEDGLRALGYTDDGVEKAFGYMREGKVHGLLRDSDAKVFQTALGHTPLPWQAHIKMMAAAQPFLSGAISKTINMPQESTVEDVKAAFRLAHVLGLKSVAIYRDGSKGMQPVTIETKKDEPQEIKTVLKRKRLQDTRGSITHRFTIDTHTGYFTVGFYPDGSPGEIFITMAKEGSTISGLLDSFGIAISIGLQFGIPLKVFVEKFKHSRFEPQGFTKNPDIRLAKSIVDYIARWLELRFLDAKLKEELDAWETASDELSLDAPLCDNCGSMMNFVGSCYVCSNCGTTGGCS